jgi:hypothetical protein
MIGTSSGANEVALSKRTWKDKLFRELVEYWINVIYLAVVFAAFTEYQRLVLAAHDIVYTNYWVAVIEALILAKVILIGEVVRLGRGLEDKPLIYSTVYKSLVFSVFVGLFKVIERTVVGLFGGEGLMGGVAHFSEKGPHLVLANSLVVFVALLPFFGVRELGRVLGERRIRDLFFQTRSKG